MPDPLVPNDLSEDQLKWGYWFVTHKIMLRRLLAAVLIVFSAATLGFSGYFLTLDILNSSERAAELNQLLTSGVNHAVTLAQAPQPLQLSSAQVLVTQGKYDLIGTVANPNQDFAARFTYRFTGGSFASDPADEFILPGDQKFVVQLGNASATRPSNATLELLSVSWERIDRHLYPDWKSFAAAHLDLPVSNIAYTGGIDIGSGKTAIGRTSFTITNDTGYGYYGLKALVLMYHGPAVVAAGTATFASLPPSAAAAGEITWYDDYGAVSLIKVIPEINILDSASFIRSR